MQQAQDFVDESDVLAARLDALDGQDWDRPTQFKHWSCNDILVHLHFWNEQADLSLTDPERFKSSIADIQAGIQSSGMRAIENARIGPRGAELLAQWRALYRDIGRRWSTLDPRQRVQWAGPDMSVRSSMTARQMETWAHGQAAFDLFGAQREESDRIKNIVVLGVNTFGWSYQVRGLKVPEQMPALKLRAPSGANWEFGDAQSGDSIEGEAVEFAQVVTQTRNIADTGLTLCGDVAREWMAHAQCFAGAAHAPPEANTRYRQ